MHTALRDTSETIRAHLLATLQDTAGVLGGLFSGGGLEVLLKTPQEMASGNNEGLSVWLYRVCRDAERLNAPPPRIGAEEQRRPLPMRLHYLTTPVLAADAAVNAEREHLILGRVLQALHDKPVFRGPELAGNLAGGEAELRVRLEPASLEEITRIWDALKSPYQLSVSYEVTVAYVESDRAGLRVGEVTQVLAANAGPGAGVGIDLGPPGGGAA